MQKFYPGCKYPLWSLFNLKMKLTIALLFFSNLLIYAGPIAGQSMYEVKINLSASKMPVQEVIGLIEKQSHFVIGYKNMDALKNKKVTIHAQGKSVAAILNEVMAPSSMEITQISDTYIIINPKSNLAPTVISGVVKDKRTGQTLPGVSIKVKGTVVGTQTDINGNYTLSVREDKANFTLVVSYIGYKSQEFNITRSAALVTQNVQLEEDLLGLDEVVVTGQGIDVSKRRLSTNVVSISGADIEKTPGTRLDQLLQAKLPNAQIRMTGGQAGATSIIRARGVISAYLNSSPVIYVDGVRMDNLNTASTLGGGAASGAAVSSLADIPMDNIEKIEYINGGAATTLYGSDAANGVIQIITKKGGGDRTAITLNVEAGPEVSTNDFLNFKRTKDMLFETGTFQKYNVAVSGSKNGIGYSFTGGYLNSTGVQIENQNSNKRIDMRSGFKANIGDKITYESSFTFVNNSYKRSRNGNQGGYTGLWFLESGASAVTGPKPNFKPQIDELSEEDFEKMKAYVREAERLQDNEIVVNRFQTSQTFNYRPTENLVFKAVGGIDYRNMRNKVITTNEYIAHTTGNPSTAGGSISNADRKYWGLTMELNGQHKAELGDFSFVTTFGGQLFRNEDRQVAYNGTNVRDGMRDIRTVGATTANEVFTEVVNYGVYVQENLGFKNKFFIDLGLRGDGNSAFGKDIGVQYYPKVGFAYIPTAESWFRDAVPVISSAKIRASYGLAGNFPPAFRNRKTIGFASYLGTLGASFGTPEVDLRPEKTTTFEGGMDLGILSDRIVLTAVYYHATTNDALFNVPSVPSTGEVAAVRNVGELLNRGFEFSINVTPIKTTDVSLSVNVSANTSYNRVVSSNGSAAFNLNGFSERTIQTVVQEGYPVGFLRGGYGTFGEDGVMNSTTPLQYLGSTIPDLFGSMGINFQYKDFNFFANADYQSGAYASNWDKQFRYNYGVSNEGIPQGEIDKNKRTNWLNFSNMFVEKTDFIKVRTIGASYLFHGPKLGKAIKNLTIGFSVVNPLNFASSSFDPEATTSGSAQGQGGATTGGISYATYSAPRQFLGSVKVNF
ncbi:TonB-dependent receptor domain-containing protein [Pedobacter sp. AW31-3R]|uniref:TonB-dependent receptor domain-containing protein n=1 Tax=Pedobacter sp. AW31-3R TaxID=3445781 RepID=UPI003F9EE9D2